MFRLEEMWLKREDFISSVPIWWSEVNERSSAILTFTAKLRHCRNMIKKWRAAHFYSIKGAKTEIMSEIQRLDSLEEQQELAPNILAKREELRTNLSRVLDDKELL